VVSQLWSEKAEGVRWRIQPFIDGVYRQSKASDSVDHICPATERPLCRYSVGNADDVDAAVRIARQRFRDGSWSKLSPDRRSGVLRKLADLLVQHREEIALLDTLEMGKPISAALTDADTFAPYFLRSSADLSVQLFGRSVLWGADAVVMNVHEPRGVVGAITPWNFPIVNATIKISAALAAGNSVVLKPSEIAPSSALRLAELAVEAGLPTGVLNVVPGAGSTTGSALAIHPDVDLLTFTGSTATGRKIMVLSGESNGKPLMLECGGKSPQVVFDDVSDLEHIADTCLKSAFWNSGQVCSARTRLLIHRSIAEPLRNLLVEGAKQYVPSNPLCMETSFGPLASSAQRLRVKTYVSDAIKSGVRALLEGEIQGSGGCYVSPTILDEVEPSSAVWREEVFGPVLCVKIFSTDDEAVELANGTSYGLSSTLWTRDLGRSQRLVREIRAGEILIRTGSEELSESSPPLGYEPQKASGFGCEMGLEGIKSYCTTKLVRFSGT